MSRRALILLAVLGGCLDSSPPGGDDGEVGGDEQPGPEVDPGPGACVDHMDCPPRQRCDEGLCASEQACVSDLQCGSASVCEDGECAFRGDCIRDEQCGPGRICHEFRCVDVSECGADGCPDGHVCRDGLCLPTFECRQDADCARGEACAAERCVPAGDCFGRPACTEGQRCDEFSGRCVDIVGCSGPAGGSLCPGGMVCIGGVCRAQSGCGTDTDCEGGLICEAGGCVPGPECWDDTDCGGRARCDEGVCQPVQCLDDSQCRAGARCVQGWCLGSDFCEGPDDCPPARPVCEAGACRGAAACVEDAECEAGVCHDGGCVEAPDEGCRRDGDCQGGQVCELGVCEQGCAGDADCPADRTCVAARCRPPLPCADDVECPGEQVCDDQRCTGPPPGGEDGEGGEGEGGEEIGEEGEGEPDPPPPDVEPCGGGGVIAAQGVQTLQGDTTGGEPGWGDRGPADVYTFRLDGATSVELLVQADPAWNTYLYLLRGPCDAPVEVAANDDLQWRRSSFILSGPMPAGIYQAVVTGAGAGDSGAYTLTARFTAVPANDRCEDAVVVDETANLRGSTRAAGAEDGRGPDVWYRIDLQRATALQIFMDSGGAPAWNTFLRLYRGDCPPGDRERMAENDDLQWRRSSFIASGPLEAGTYHLLAMGAGALDYGEFDLNIELLEVPEEDGCPRAVELPAEGRHEIQATTRGAASSWDARDSPATWYRIDPPEPAPDGGDDAEGVAVSLHMDSAANGGDPWNTYLHVARGECDALEPVAANDDLQWRRTSGVVTAPLEPGVPYHVIASGAGAWDFGAFGLTADFHAVPANDRCADAAPLDISSPDAAGGANADAAAGTTAGAGWEHDPARNRGPDVWYGFTLDAPASLDATLDSTAGGAPAWNTYLYLLRGACGDLEPVAENDDAQWRRSSRIEADRLEPGDYLLVATGAGRRDFGRFSLTTVLAAPR